MGSTISKGLNVGGEVWRTTHNVNSDLWLWTQLHQVCDDLHSGLDTLVCMLTVLIRTKGNSHLDLFIHFKTVLISNIPC